MMEGAIDDEVERKTVGSNHYPLDIQYSSKNLTQLLTAAELSNKKGTFR